MDGFVVSDADEDAVAEVDKGKRRQVDGKRQDVDGKRRPGQRKIILQDDYHVPGGSDAGVTTNRPGAEGGSGWFRVFDMGSCVSTWLETRIHTGMKRAYIQA
jgi:hypothetical protein